MHESAATAPEIPANTKKGTFVYLWGDVTPVSTNQRPERAELRSDTILSYEQPGGENSTRPSWIKLCNELKVPEVPILCWTKHRIITPQWVSIVGASPVRNCTAHVGKSDQGAEKKICLLCVRDVPYTEWMWPVKHFWSGTVRSVGAAFRDLEKVSTGFVCRSGEVPTPMPACVIGCGPVSSEA